jgi:ribonuclease inhibitor
MKRATIPADAKSMAKVYNALARDLALPAHFGRNLDALWDCLSRDVEGPFEIEVENAKALTAATGAKGEALLKLLRDLRRERADATIRIRGAR